jgi:hypothetical protein
MIVRTRPIRPMIKQIKIKMLGYRNMQVASLGGAGIRKGQGRAPSNFVNSLSGRNI